MVNLSYLSINVLEQMTKIKKRFLEKKREAKCLPPSQGQGKRKESWYIVVAISSLPFPVFLKE